MSNALDSAYSPGHNKSISKNNMPLHTHEPVSTSGTQSGWVAAPEDTGQTPAPVLRSWLTEPGLLTARLRTSCADEFSLAVLEHSPPTGDTPARRRIFLRCGKDNCVYAETLIPEETIAAHSWLNVLGDEPLGERLAMQPGVSRSEFRFCLLNAAALPAELADTQQLLWARQSEFTLGDNTLTVTEIFLPALASAAGPN
jgi:chorismate--pyruvate lyase